MYNIDFSTIEKTLNSFFSLVGGFLSFDKEAYRACVNQEGGVAVALAILIISGISLGFGQSVVLFVNRVRRRRFVISLLLSGLVFLAGVLAWTGSVWLLSRLITRTSIEYMTIFTGAAISMSPLLFGFFVLLPYLGNFIYQILRIWALLIYLVVIDTITGIGFWWALGLSLLGWILLELIIRLPALRFDRIRSWYWRLTTGTTHRQEIDEVVNRFISDIRSFVIRNQNQKGDDQ